MSLAWFRRTYGASALHLLALIASFAFAGYAAVAWLQLGVRAIVLWFVVALIAHDLILLPLYTLLDWIAFGGRKGRARAARAAVSPVPYVRVPALLSGMLALVFAPEILGFDSVYRDLTGIGEGGLYLRRWLAATAVMFALSGLGYAVALRRVRIASAPPADQSNEP